jgi:5-formyltetrahydrofolate cyclo-ligase
MTPHDPSKSSLRVQYSALRARAHADDPDAPGRLAAVLAGFALFRPGMVLAGYFPIGTELDPRPAMLAARAAGLRLAMVQTMGADQALEFRTWDGQAPSGLRMGVPNPDPHAPAVWPDVVLLPLLACDRTGNRLGRGGGHYDRTFGPQAPYQRRPPFLIGVCHGAQLAPQLPREPHDAPLDLIATPDGLIRVHRR